MLMAIGKAILVAIIVIVLLLFFALLLGFVPIDVADAIAAFIKTWAPAIGIIAGLWYFFTHQS